MKGVTDDALGSRFHHLAFPPQWFIFNLKHGASGFPGRQVHPWPALVPAVEQFPFMYAKQAAGSAVPPFDEEPDALSLTCTGT
jgi:hypothetical protein